MAVVAVPLLIAGGSMALQMLLAPRVKQQPIDKGKFDRVDVTGSEFGAYIPRIWGDVRLAGNIIFAIEIQEYIVETRGGGGGGGKGGGGNSVERSHIYQTDVGVLFAQQIDTFLTIWSDNDIIVNNIPAAAERFYEAENLTLAGGASSYSDGTASGGAAVTNLGSGGTATLDATGFTVPYDPDDPDDPDEFPDFFTKISFYYKSNADATVDLLINGSINDNVFLPNSGGVWTAAVKIIEEYLATLRYGSSGTASPDLDKIGIYRFTLREDYPPSLAQNRVKITGYSNPNIAYPADLDDPTEFYNYQPTLDAQGETSANPAIPSETIRTYTGQETQTQDAAHIAWLDGRFGAGEGILRTPAYRGSAWVVFDNRTLKQPRIDNFSALMRKGAATTTIIIQDILSSVGLSSSDWDTTAAAGLSNKGYVEHQQQSRNQLIEPLLRWHLLRLGEIDGVITVIDERSDSVYTFDENDLRASAEGSELPQFDAELVRQEEHLTPYQVRVSFMNPANDYHNDSAESDPNFSHSGTETKDYSFPIVSDFATAQLTANLLHAKETTEVLGFEWFGMPNTAHNAIGDVITLPIHGVNYKVRIEKIQRQLPIGVIRYQGIVTEPNLYLNATGSEDTVHIKKNTQVKLAPRNSIIHVIQSVPVRESDIGKLGVYLGVSGRGRGDWQNCTIYRENGLDNWELQQIVNTETTSGIVRDAMTQQYTAGSYVEDTVNKPFVEFFNDVSLETISFEDLLADPYLNLVCIGQEWLQFNTVFGGLSYDLTQPYAVAGSLSGLLRAKFRPPDQGLTEATTGHVANEYATLFSDSLIFFELERKDVGQQIRLKAVTNGQHVDYAPISTFTFTPAGSTPALTSEALSAGDLVNIYNDGGVTKVRKANAGTPARFANGFVNKNYGSGEYAYTYSQGINNFVYNLTPGKQFLSTTAGKSSNTPATGAGKIVQEVGTALSGKQLEFKRGNVVELS